MKHFVCSLGKADAFATWFLSWKREDFIGGGGRVREGFIFLVPSFLVPVLLTSFLFSISFTLHISP